MLGLGISSRRITTVGTMSCFCLGQIYYKFNIQEYFISILYSPRCLTYVCRTSSLGSLWNASARRFLKRACGLMVASTVRRIWEMILSYQRRLFQFSLIGFHRPHVHSNRYKHAILVQHICYLSIWFFTLITESLLAPSCSSGPPQEENQEHQEALRGNKGLGAVPCLPFILGEICGPRSIQEWIKCLWNANRALWLKPQILHSRHLTL